MDCITESTENYVLLKRQSSKSYKYLSSDASISRRQNTFMLHFIVNDHVKPFDICNGSIIITKEWRGTVSEKKVGLYFYPTHVSTKKARGETEYKIGVRAKLKNENETK